MHFGYPPTSKSIIVIMVLFSYYDLRNGAADHNPISFLPTRFLGHSLFFNLIQLYFLQLLINSYFHIFFFSKKKKKKILRKVIPHMYEYVPTFYFGFWLQKSHQKLYYVDSLILASHLADVPINVTKGTL
jgi:hypothetical protein